MNSPAKPERGPPDGAARETGGGDGKPKLRIAPPRRQADAGVYENCGRRSSARMPLLFFRTID
jgi:hypothetical protein